jgi:hypothetical protein
MSKASDTSHACDIMSHGSMAFTPVPSGWFVAVLTANYHWHGANAKSCAAFKRID